jgi:HEAT repeat protein
MKSSLYRSTLRSLPDWEPYLRDESGLPGPRGNLELVQAVADEATPDQIEHLLSYTPDIAPENTPEAFLAVCGTVALGRLIVEGRAEILPRLHELANDPRWRVREAVAMALQRVGDADMGKLLSMVQSWANGTLLEQRALAAGICEPRLLQNLNHARAVLDLLDQITHNILAVPDRKDPAFQVLRKGLAYCWSVAVAALPAEGKPRFATWLANPDPDIRWILRENLKKNRLAKMDSTWVAEMNSALQLS